MQVIIHKQIDSLGKIFPKWETLKDEFREITVFQDIGWIKSWWDYKSKQRNITPYIIEIKELDKTVGIIPLYIMKIRFSSLSFRILKPMGSELSDYLLPILSKEYSPQQLLSLALENIYKDKLSWDCIEWGDVPENSFFAQFLNNQLFKKKALMEKKSADICPYLILNNNIEEVKLKLNKTFLKDILKKERKLIKRGELAYNKVLKEQEIEPVMNKFFELHCERWGKTNTPSRFKSLEEREHALLAAKNLLKSNLLYLTYLSHDKEIIAGEFGMSDGKRLYLYIPVFNIKYKNYSVGSLLKYYIIQDACKDGYEIVDFLRGNEKHKGEWGTIEKFNVKYVFFNSSLKSFIFKITYQTYHSNFLKLYNKKFITKRLFTKSVES